MLGGSWDPVELFFRLGTFKSWCYKTQILNKYQNYIDPSSSRTLPGGSKIPILSCCSKKMLWLRKSLHMYFMQPISISLGEKKKKISSRNDTVNLTLIDTTVSIIALFPKELIFHAGFSTNPPVQICNISYQSSWIRFYTLQVSYYLWGYIKYINMQETFTCNFPCYT